MLEAKHISAEELRIQDYVDPEFLRRVFREYHLESAQDLIGKWESIPELKDNIHVKLCVGSVKYKLYDANKIERKPIIFQPKRYQDSSLEYNDLLNTGSVLLLGNPTGRFIINALYHTKDMTIDDIRKQISYTDFKGRNLLSVNCWGIGDVNCQRISDAINFYREQVERQSLLTDDRSKNLFTFQQEEKRQIVEKYYEKIIYHFIFNAKELIWGKLSNSQKGFLIASVDSIKALDLQTKERLVSLFADYTTLPELEEFMNGNYEALDNRFIKVKK